MTLVSKKILTLTLVFAGSVFLSACSSKPSPWSESESPWDSRAEQSDDEGADSLNPMLIEEGVLPAGADEDTVIEQPMEVIEEPMLMVEEPMQMEETPMFGGGIASQPPGYYTVQVVASSSMDKLTAFARRNQISEQWVAQTNVYGKSWYVLLLGIYPGKAEAEQALMTVQGLETRPWIRTVGSIQAVMR